jgi:enhancer of mRNA-decapping protein 3
MMISKLKWSKKKSYSSKRLRNESLGRGAHEVDVVPTKETTRSKGWRKTPLLEPNPSFQPFNSLKRNNRRGKQRIDEAGWATEDASEVQELGDFDFERSLAKFDKQSVFQKIQAEDSIAEEDRLVSHNRIPRNVKPGTNGGKNYRYDENVLGGENSTTNGSMKNVTPKGTPKVKQEVWRSEDDEEERARGMGSGRQSRRGESKLATSRRPSERKGSAVVGGQAAVRSHSVSSCSLLLSLTC